MVPKIGYISLEIWCPFLIISWWTLDNPSKSSNDVGRMDGGVFEILSVDDEKFKKVAICSDFLLFFSLGKVQQGILDSV